MAFDTTSYILGSQRSGGGGGSTGGMVVNAPYDEDTNSYVCDKTFQEINDAFNAGTHIVIVQYATFPVVYINVDTDSNIYEVGCLIYDDVEDKFSGYIFSTNSTDGYPTATS